MGKKQILEEGTIRQFMKLANLDASLTSNFITETFSATDLPEPMTEADEDEMALGDEMADIDLGAEDELAPEMEGEPADEGLTQAIEGAIEDFIRGGAAAVSEAHPDVDVSVEGTEEPEMEMSPEDAEADFEPVGMPPGGEEGDEEGDDTVI